MRPTKYTEEILKLTLQYTEDHTKHGHLIPTIEGLATILDVSKKTIYNWKNKPGNEDFLHALDMLHNKQHLELLNKGLTGEFNAAIVKLMLVNNHGYINKKSIEGRHTHEIKSNKKPTRAELIEIIQKAEPDYEEAA